jgi:hypothetical protein
VAWAGEVGRTEGRRSDVNPHRGAMGLLIIQNRNYIRAAGNPSDLASFLLLL